MRTRHGPGGPDDGRDHHLLTELLAAATAPARGGELAREEEVVAAFRAAHRPPVLQTQRRSMIKSALAKLLTVKAAALATAVAGVGGVALAASTGTLPGPSDKAGPAASAPQSPGREKAKPSDRPSDRASRPAVPSGFPRGLYWLCTDYIGRDAEHRGKALGQPKYRELAERAGGKDREKADKFCDKLLNHADPPAGRPSSAPKATKSPGANKPSRAPDRPAGRPSGDQPSTHPNR
jgi:hypothetical protein